ncbi:MAG: RDD family protein [Chloroflexi bacterium]|nr:RDD family protein [Chloroflexota bacterium]|tara:strand:- start:1261 stop:1770 length:510 start_codon:yes stop_codon:yes gene_type:complete
MTNIKKETLLAERSQRFYAFVIDSLFSFSISFLIPVIFSILSFDSNFLLALFSFFIVVSIQGYLLINTGQSIGKRLMKIRIVDAVTLNIPSIQKVFLIRYILIWQIPNLISLFLIQDEDLILNPSSNFTSPENLISLVAFMVLAQTLLIFKTDRRCGHDLISGTIVEKI